jgi:hypothetical protein
LLGSERSIRCKTNDLADIRLVSTRELQHTTLMPELEANKRKARKPSSSELNDRQRKFAERIVAGDTAPAAYAKSFPRCKSKSTAEQEGCKLLKNPKVAAFI